MFASQPQLPVASALAAHCLGAIARVGRPDCVSGSRFLDGGPSWIFQWQWGRKSKRVVELGMVDPRMAPGAGDSDAPFATLHLPCHA